MTVRLSRLQNQWGSHNLEVSEKVQMVWFWHLSFLLCHNQIIIVLRQDFQLSSISTITKMTSKRKQAPRSPV